MLFEGKTKKRTEKISHRINQIIVPHTQDADLAFPRSGDTPDTPNCSAFFFSQSCVAPGAVVLFRGRTVDYGFLCVI